MQADVLKQLVRGIMGTEPEEMGCDDCFDHLDRFVDMELAGKNPAEAMPLVHDHLRRCPACRDEFEALLEAVKALAAE